MISTSQVMLGREVNAAPQGRSSVAWWYVRAIPARIRAWLRARAWLGARLALRRMTEPGLTMVRADGGYVIGSIRDDAAPAVVRRSIAEQVTGVLDAAGIDYFWVRGYDVLTSTIGVHAADRRSALAALRRYAQGRALYVSALSGSGVVSRVEDPRPRLGAHVRSWERLGDANIVRLHRFVADPSGSLLLGGECGCEIEFWTEDTGHLIAPRPNRMVDRIAADGVQLTLPESDFTAMVDRADRGSRLPTRAEFVGRPIDRVTFPIDAVYPWVDCSDPAWQAKRDAAVRAGGLAAAAPLPSWGRHADHDRLRYSLRSLWMFAPWVRKIWLVTDDQVPSWLSAEAADVEVVSHKQIFAEPDILPVFNNHAVESQLHHIDGLAEHFLYLTDDLLLGRPLSPEAFFQPNGLSHVFPSRSKVPLGPVDQSVDPAATAAAKNNRMVVQRDFGRHLTIRMQHTPYPMRRGVLAEMEARYRAEFAETARQRFPGPRDLSVASSLYPHYAFLTGRAVFASIRGRAVTVAPAEMPASGPSLTGRGDDVFRLAGGRTAGADLAGAWSRLTSEFLARYYPTASPWER
jgi:hypothetical protein